MPQPTGGSMAEQPIEVHGVQAMEQLGESIAKSLHPGDVVALQGQLGAGKTSLVRGIARALGVPAGLVSSPTFVTLQHYPAANGITVAHVDAYRFKSAAELAATGWDELLETPVTIVLVEWPERIAEAIPPAHLAIQIDAADGGSSRLVTIRDGRSPTPRRG